MKTALSDALLCACMAHLGGGKDGEPQEEGSRWGPLTREEPKSPPARFQPWRVAIRLQGPGSAGTAPARARLHAPPSPSPLPHPRGPGEPMDCLCRACTTNGGPLCTGVHVPGRKPRNHTWPATGHTVPGSWGREVGDRRPLPGQVETEGGSGLWATAERDLTQAVGGISNCACLTEKKCSFNIPKKGGGPLPCSPKLLQIAPHCHHSLTPHLLPAIPLCKASRDTPGYQTPNQWLRGLCGSLSTSGRWVQGTLCLHQAAGQTQSPQLIVDVPTTAVRSQDSVNSCV